MKLTTIFLVTVFQIASLSAQNFRDSLKLELTNFINQSRIPGLGVSLVSEKGILYVDGFGLRNRNQKMRYDSVTVQPVASISKTMVAIALMKLVETGKLDLHADINNFLPFKVVNPNFPKSKITLFQLATHTSSITDTDESDDGGYYILDKNASKKIFPKGAYNYYKKYLKNGNLELEDYLQSFLSANGKNFNKSIFGKFKPDQEYVYSNVGTSLAAYVVELVSGQPFEKFTEEHIFKPLGMKNTGWHKMDVDSSNLTDLHFQNGSKVPDYSLIAFPAGGLHTNSYDMGKFLHEIIKGYNGQGSLLKSESYQFMLTNRLTGSNMKKKRGIFWSVDTAGNNIGHDGAEIGTASQMIFNPRLNKGFFMMVNISEFEDDNLTEDYIKILMLLSKYLKELN